MALDRSPESFSPQMNSTSLFLWFQLVIPSFDPKGHHMNKIHKGLQGDATYQQEGHDGPVSLHWLIREIPAYQALQYLGIVLKHRPLRRTKIGSHSSYVKHQKDFEILHDIKPCKNCNPWQSIRP